MPHLVILYTRQLDAEVQMTTLCRQMANAMLTVKDEEGKQVFPTGGTRVLAYPAPHYAVADGGEAGREAGGTGDYAFVYLNVRMGRAAARPRSNALGIPCSKWPRPFLRRSWRSATSASRCKLTLGLKCLTPSTATSIRFSTRLETCPCSPKTRSSSLRTS